MLKVSYGTFFGNLVNKADGTVTVEYTLRRWIQRKHDVISPLRALLRGILYFRIKTCVYA